MKVLTDQSGYVTDFAIIGDISDSIEVPDPVDFDHFVNHFSAYRLEDGSLLYDISKESEIEIEAEKNELRHRRREECFPIINRGRLWYERLTTEQIEELDIWYRLWLDAPETRIVPEAPEWVADTKEEA